MKKFSRFFILPGLLIVSFGVFGCRSVTQITKSEECDINQRDVEGSLGANVKYLDKTNPLLNLSPAEKADPKVKACGYQADDGSFVYVQRNDHTNEQEAAKFYDFWKDFLINTEKKNAGDYWEDDVLAVGDKCYMVHAYHADGLHVDVVVKRGNVAFTIRSNGAKTNKTFSHVRIKGLAHRIGDKFN